MNYRERASILFLLCFSLFQDFSGRRGMHSVQSAARVGRTTHLVEYDTGRYTGRNTCSHIQKGNNFNSSIVSGVCAAHVTPSVSNIKDVRDNLTSQNERNRGYLTTCSAVRAKYRVFNAVIHCLVS